MSEPLEVFGDAFLNLSCEKCGHWHDHRVEFYPEYLHRMGEPRAHLLVTCARCSAEIGKFSPLDANPTPPSDEDLAEEIRRYLRAANEMIAEAIIRGMEVRFAEVIPASGPLPLPIIRREM